MKHRVRPLALLVLIASGCGVNSLLDKLDAEGEKSVDLACSCTNVFPDRAACEAMFGSFFTFFDRGCVEDALAEDKDGSKATLKCILDKSRDYNKCLEDNLDCNDYTSIEGCEQNFAGECPELPAAVNTALQACGGTTD